MAEVSRLQGRAVYLVDGSRTPHLKARGRPGPFTAADLAVACGRDLLLRQPFPPETLDEVIWGCIAPRSDETNIARIAALRMGCGHRVPAHTVQRNCGSGMQAIDSGAMLIAAGRADLILAGGTEAMSHSPVLLSDRLVHWLADWRGTRGPWARLRLLGRLRAADLAPVLGLLRGLTDPVVGLSMGQTAEVLAEQLCIGREAMDAYALRSHQRLATAHDGGHLAAELAPLAGPDGHLHDHDTGLRRDTDLTRLAALPAAFDKPYGRVTAGNSAQVSDGAACLLLASEAALQRHGLTPLARLVDVEWAALDPARMGLGPVHAATPLLRRQGLGLADLDYLELNEAFAAQVLACLAAWRDARYCRQHLDLPEALGEVDPERLNVDGGAIALGHPVGTSGARIVLHLLRVLEREGARRGLATLCIGGGQGGAMLVERE